MTWSNRNDAHTGGTRIHRDLHRICKEKVQGKIVMKKMGQNYLKAILKLKGTATLIISIFYWKELYKTMNFDTRVIKIG